MTKSSPGGRESTGAMSGDAGAATSSSMRVPPDADKITKTERVELARIARLRARVARSAVAQREAELLADVEAQLSAEYRFDEDAWADVTAAAEAKVAAADAEVARRCAELGIPVEFRPRISIGWSPRGENMFAGRRAELRKRAQTRIAAVGKAAKAAIEATEADVLVSLYAGSLSTTAAHAFLAAIPSAEALMPPMRLAELEAAGASL